jgi:hypothetical protein
MKHFAQAKSTPFAKYDGTAAFASSIKVNSQHDKRILDLFNQSIHSIPKKCTNPNITEDEWKHKFSKWPEKVTTSPSGMHLGHYKSQFKPHKYSFDNESKNKKKLDTQQQRITKAQIDLINSIVDNRLTLERWKIVHSILLFKDKTNRYLHRT